MKTEMTYVRRIRTAAFYLTMLPAAVCFKRGLRDWWDDWSHDVQMWRRGDF